MRVAYQAGVLLALEEAGLEFFHVDGTSGGIFNTAMLASGLKPKEMARRWRKLKLKSFVSGRKAQNYLKPFKMQGYADADNIRNKVFPSLGISLNQIQSEQHAHVTFNVCNFSEKKVEALPGNQSTEDHLIAGVSLPIFMPALKIGEDWYSDAVWIKDANLVEAVHQGADEIWLVWAIGNSPSYLRGAFSQYVHMIEMSANGGLLEDYKQIKLIDQLHQKEIPTKLFVIKSSIPLPLDPDFFFNKINARELINMGYAHAKEYLLTSSQHGEKLDESATQCKEPSHTLSFRGTYEGTLVSENSKVPVTYYVFYRFSSFSNTEKILESYSSIQIANEEEIPLYDHRFEASNANSHNTHTIKARFHRNGELLSLTSVQQVDGPWDIFTGLGFKKITLSLRDNMGKELYTGTLYQSLANRLKSRYFTKLTSWLPDKTGIKTKFNLIKDFTEYGL
ncbi:hypothetical protein GCM10028791_24690 [Echinicola sediminis]